MPRWTQNLIWVVGAITLWCPYCMCLFGGESWWACFNSAGLIAIAVSSGYATWTGLNMLLSNNPFQYSILVKFKSLLFNGTSSDAEAEKKAQNNSIKAMDIDDIENEIAVFAQSFHTQYVLPWYTVVSPDEKYSRQIKCALQDMLSNVLMHLQLNSNPCELISSVVHSYIEHYRHFVLTLKKVSNETSCKSLSEVGTEDILKSYTPAHSALRDENGYGEYCQKLAHIFLVDHLPHEITRCSLLFTVIRDAFAQNVLVSLLEHFSEPVFLNELVLQLIRDSGEFTALAAHDDSIIAQPETGDEEVTVPMSYIHRLSLIHEESSVDLLETDLAALGRLLPETIPEEDSCASSEESPVPRTTENCRTLEKMSIESALGALISTTAAPILSRQYPFSVGQVQSNVMRPFHQNDYLFESSPDFEKRSLLSRPSNSPDYPKATVEIWTKMWSEQEFKCPQKSSSLEDLLPLEFSSTDRLQIQSATKMSYSSEDLRLAVRGKDRRLVKMASFDRNDGTDEQSLQAEGTDKAKGGTPSPKHDREQKSGIVTEQPLDDSTKGKSCSSLEESSELSPIYEESESLATAIAKLRSLLTEKEGQTSLGSQSSFGSNESEPKSAQSDPGRYGLEKSRFNFLHKDSSGSLASIKSYSSSDSCLLEDVLEVPEVPYDGRVFLSVSIPTTEVHIDHIDGQYTHFVIQYEAIYLCESLNNDQSANVNGPQPSESRMILQTNSVKRRFGEFLALHAALEEDVSFKVIMKTIKGPNKWLNLPFSKLDSATVSSRKQFLEKYLTALISLVELNISPQLKDFLAYSSKSSVSLMKKPLELNVPRLDKMFARTVSGMFHSIKTALPTFDSIENNANGGPTTIKSVLPFTDSLKSQLSEKKPLKSPMNLGPEYRLKIDVTAEEDFCEMEGALVNEISSASFKNSPIEAAYEALETHQFMDFFLSKRDSSPPLDGRSDGHAWGSESADNFWKELKRAVMLSSQRTSHDAITDSHYQASPDALKLYFALTDLFVELLSTSDSVWTREFVVKMVENLMADDIAKLLLASVKSTFDPAYFKEAIGFLTNLMEKQSTPNDPNSSLIPERLSAEITLYVNTALPGILKLFFSQELIESHTRLLVTSFQHRIVNLDLGLHLLDLIFSQFISK